MYIFLGASAKQIATISSILSVFMEEPHSHRTDLILGILKKICRHFPVLVNDRQKEADTIWSLRSLHVWLYTCDLFL